MSDDAQDGNPMALAAAAKAGAGTWRGDRASVAPIPDDDLRCIVNLLRTRARSLLASGAKDSQPFTEAATYAESAAEGAIGHDALRLDLWVLLRKHLGTMRRQNYRMLLVAYNHSQGGRPTWRVRLTADGWIDTTLRRVLYDCDERNNPVRRPLADGSVHVPVRRLRAIAGHVHADVPAENDPLDADAPTD